MNKEEQKKRVLLSPPYWGRDEMNLVEFPFALLTDRAMGIVTLEFSDYIPGEGGKPVVRKWTVTASEKFGMPTRDDERVYVALMQITKENGLDSPRQFFSRYRVLNAIGWEQTGHYYKRVGESLDRLMGVTVKAENAFYDPKTRAYSTESFHIIDNYRLWDRLSTSGQQNLPLSYFKWNEIIWKSIKAGYIKKLDTRFWFSLKGAAARRMYRYLDKKFYQKDVFAIAVDKLALEKLGVNRASRPAKRRAQIEKAARELIERGYLKEFSFERSHGRMIATFKRHGNGSKGRKTGLSDEQSSLKSELEKWGVTRGIARRLVLQHPSERVREKIELTGHLMADGHQDAVKNPGGFLRSAIEDDYALPKGFMTSAQRKKQKEETDREYKLNALYRAESEFKDWLRQSIDQRVSGNVFVFEMRYKRQHNKPPTQAEREHAKREAIDQLPTEDEYWQGLVERVKEDCGELNPELLGIAEKLKERAKGQVANLGLKKSMEESSF